MRTIVVAEGQSLIDIAVQELGNADGLAAICAMNDLDFDADLLSGQLLALPDLDVKNDIQHFFKIKDLQVNTHLAGGTVEVLGTNDDEGLTDNDNNGLNV